MARNQKSKIRRSIAAKIKGQKLYDPTIFLSPRRLDIAAKTIFARAYIEGNTSEWPEHVYKEHIRSFNDFIEKEPVKNSFSEFKESFLRTIDGVRDDDSWKHSAPVQQNGKYLVNGAHRVAASIVVGDKVNVETPEFIHEDTYNYDYFRRDRSGIDAIDETVLDYMTIEYVSIKKKNIFAVIIFPTAEGYRDEAYQHLLSLGEIVNMKTFKHDEFEGKEIIKQLYFNSNGDSWNYGLSFDSAEHKAALCFDGINDLQVYIIEANLDETSRIKEKQYLRDLWKKDKHSIHITDTIDEANRIVRMFFHENSRNFLKLNREKEFASQEMYDMFNEYISLLPKDIIERDKIVIEGSAVLDLLNIRPGRDIDYIARDPKINFLNKNIEKHDTEENKYHTQHIDEITTNPEYYFYYKGYKFIDITELEKYKQARLVEGNQKDANDLLLIKDFLRTNPFMGNTEGVDILNTPKVSIIVPIYNTPKDLLKKCLDSINSQYYPHIQVILVNDGSNKVTTDFIDSYVAKIDAREDRSWQVIYQENKGVSSARNNGYRSATGKYIQFIDADDYTYRKLISSAVDRAELTAADIVIENFTIRHYKTSSETVKYEVNDLPTKLTFALGDIEGSIATVSHNVWSKLYSKKLLDTHALIHDETLLRAEDVLFSGSALAVAQKITILPDFYITYREGVPTSNSKLNDKHPFDSLQAWKKLYAFINTNKKNNLIKNDFEKAMIESIYWHYMQLNDENNKIKLAKKALVFFNNIQVGNKNDQYIELALASTDKQLLEIINTRRDELDARANEILQVKSNTENELAILRKPGVRLATLKLAGAVKRKIKKTIRRSIKDV